MAKVTCSIEGCGNPIRARGWCNKHYLRWLQYGDTDAIKVIRGDPEQQFWAKVEKTETCWRWTADIDRDGYTVFTVDNKFVHAHRWAYEHFVGPIPVRMTVDHVKKNGCTHRDCVNYLEHLEIVTSRENTLRGVGPSSVNSRKTHCKRGHEFTEENTHVATSGKRTCIKCRRRRKQERRKTHAG